ncbi:MAG TPA: hypothetical protein ACFYD4_10095 [Candidatus Wunengus sp. YC61]|uniref:hypothetical protein n=1 Tax=Candidatus Wunengus sp. YC61 TaxID=3367698 RepID=UPI0040251628
MPVQDFKGTINGLTPPGVGAENLKIWTYSHTITAAEIIATYTNFAITAVTLAKVRSLSVAWLNAAGTNVWSQQVARYTYLRLVSTTSFEIEFGASAAENDVISVTIIEAA